MGTITYKTKVRQLIEADDTKSPYIEFKRTVSRADCSLRPHEHTYYNSDLFLGMLNRTHKRMIKDKEWCRLRDIPEGVKVDTSKFLAVVTIELPQDFR